MFSPESSPFYLLQHLPQSHYFQFQSQPSSVWHLTLGTLIQLSVLLAFKKWMGGGKLKSNPNKTEFIITSDRLDRKSPMQIFPTQLLGNSISPTNEVKNLGVTYDTFASHISKVYHACYYHLKDLRLIH